MVCVCLGGMTWLPWSHDNHFMVLHTPFCQSPCFKAVSPKSWCAFSHRSSQDQTSKTIPERCQIAILLLLDFPVKCCYTTCVSLIGLRTHRVRGMNLFPRHWIPQWACISLLQMWYHPLKFPSVWLTRDGPGCLHLVKIKCGWPIITWPWLMLDRCVLPRTWVLIRQCPAGTDVL